MRLLAIIIIISGTILFMGNFTGFFKTIKFFDILIIIVGAYLLYREKKQY